jgi:hypothetical protein
LQFPLLFFFDALAEAQHGGEAELKDRHEMTLWGSEQLAQGIHAGL